MVPLTAVISCAVMVSYFIGRSRLQQEDLKEKDSRSTAGLEIQQTLAKPNPPSDTKMSTSNATGNTGMDVNADLDKTRSSLTLKKPNLISFVDLVEHVDKSVVRVDVMTDTHLGQGSGFVVDFTGTIATNFHVIDGAISAAVEFRDGRRALVMGTLFTDPKRDIAILQISHSAVELHPLDIATVLPKKGEQVVAFGTPLGLSFSTSEGIVSAVRSGSELTSFLRSKNHRRDFNGTWIQTTAPTSHGNSGGPLINMNGQVVGLNTLGIPDGQNINFAISCVDILGAINSATDKTVQGAL